MFVLNGDEKKHHEEKNLYVDKKGGVAMYSAAVMQVTACE